MPLTPEIWKNGFTVNTVTEGSQSDPVITQLANGNVLVVWTSNADVGVGSAAGSDVIGQILDPLGNPVGNEIRLNLSFAADDEARPAITALPNGGFVVAYQDRDANDKISLRLNEFNENGGHVSDSATISNGTGGADYYINTGNLRLQPPAIHRFWLPMKVLKMGGRMMEYFIRSTIQQPTVTQVSSSSVVERAYQMFQS